ncbi:hypothetical protein ACFSSC_06440 [Corynebacterium mendelii]|uniref:DUF11 domain-containing protein n=1 Tax=Corynebacterium mendelii TaxID=2765362 RepID=A0A939IXM3_9CORY|nr:hypothetical protein [Corynebacterium mendelii]MBN9644615.1 hypothetical protein [Corynebacterium mendelii]
MTTLVAAAAVLACAGAVISACRSTVEVPTVDPPASHQPQRPDVPQPAPSEVTASEPDFQIQSRIRLKGTKQWRTKIQAKPGDDVDIRLDYRNIGPVVQRSVVAQNRLPDQLVFHPGSVRLYNSKAPDGAKQDNSVIATGLEVGDYMPRGNFSVVFSGTVPPHLDICGRNRLVNRGVIDTPDSDKMATSVIEVTIDCAKPIKVCQTTTGKVVTIDESSFKGDRYSRNVRECSNGKNG